MAGPEIHANAIDTLLRGAPLHDTGDTADLLIALALTLLPLLLGIFLRPFLALALGLAAAVLYAVVAQIAFGRELILPVVVPLVGLAIALVGRSSLLTASVERAQTRDLLRPLRAGAGGRRRWSSATPRTTCASAASAATAR